jgi:hypothetical protein
MTTGLAGGPPLFFTIPKSAGQPNEDNWAWSHKGLSALSDGASISFDSASWSRILVRHFCRNPNFSSDWLNLAVHEFSRLYDRETLPWMKQAAYDKGSFASLIGIQLHDNRNLAQIIAIGDSLAVLCDADAIKATFPYRRSSEFEQSPQLLSTNPFENKFLDDWNSNDTLTCDWTFKGLRMPSLLCMTDALGQWLLSRMEAGEFPLKILREIKSGKAFGRFVRAERLSGRLRLDDTTLLAYWWRQ